MKNKNAHYLGDKIEAFVEMRKLCVKKKKNNQKTYKINKLIIVQIRGLIIHFLIKKANKKQEQFLIRMTSKIGLLRNTNTA